MAKSVADVTKKWADNTQAAIPRYVKGVQSTTKDPTEEAIKQQSLYIDNTRKAAESGKWASGLRRAGKSKWLKASVEKGAANITTGVRHGQDKVTQFMTAFLPYVEQGAEQVRSMPKGTEADSKARMMAMFDHNKAFKRA